MENASKALIMAGSILVALLIIGLITLSYNQISSIRQTKANADASTKLTDYAKRFEQYNTSIYGSELLSLGNLQLDYNYRQAELSGYKPVTIVVKITKEINENGRVYLSKGEQNVSSVREGISNMEDTISKYEQDSNGYENKKDKNKRSVKYYAQLTNRQIATLFDISFLSSELDYEIGDRLSNELDNPKTAKLLKDIEKYKNIKTTYTEFKNTRFTCNKATYDENGRITYMYFTEN